MRSVLILGDGKEAIDLRDHLTRSCPPGTRVRRFEPDELGTACHWTEADWVIEITGHAPDRKRSVLRRCADLTQGLVTSDSSVITRAELLADMPEGFARRHAVAHFFFPLRHCPLVELVTASTANAPLDGRHGDDLRLMLGGAAGLTAIDVPDSAGFIANRLGLFLIASGLALAREHGIDPTALDLAVAGPLGLPRTALFGTAGLIGYPTFMLLVEMLVARLPPTDPLAQIAIGAMSCLHGPKGGDRERPVVPAPGQGGDAPALALKLEAARDSYMRRVTAETGVSPEKAAEIMRQSYGWQVRW